MKLQHRILMSLLALLVVGDITQIVCKFIDKTNFRSNDLKRAADDDSLAKRGIVGKAVKAVGKWRYMHHNAFTLSQFWGRVHPAVVLGSTLAPN